MTRPNILLIQCDSMDGRVLGCMGHKAAHTPNLDRLAARGVLFTQAYCNSAVCCPSRASMWSGRHVHRIRAWNNRKGLTEDDRTFEHDLLGAGYHTTTIGRDDKYSGAHTIGCALAGWIRASGIELPRLTARPEARVLADHDKRVRLEDWERVDRAARWLQAAPQDRPFLLHLGFSQPHPMAGYNASPRYLERIPAATIDLPPQDREDHPVMRYMRVLKNCEPPFAAGEILAMRRHYHAMVSEVDAMVGDVLTVLDETGLADSTVVIFTSDHGDLQLEHGQNRKSAMYEGSVRVPLILAGPGITHDHACTDLVSLVDLYPTLMDVAGLPQPQGLDGASLQPELSGSKGTRRDHALAQYHGSLQNTGSFMLCQGEWKYVHYEGLAPQLFHVTEDPDEIDNRASTDPEQAKRMHETLHTLVDCEAVDREAKAQNRWAFQHWREQTNEKHYRKTLAEIFGGWGDEHYEQIESWLEQDEPAVPAGAMRAYAAPEPVTTA